MKLTYFFIALTALVSVPAFSNRELFDKLKFNAYLIFHKKEWHRLLSHGFVHADWGHLFFNMLAFFFFGVNVEMWFNLLKEKGVISFMPLHYGLLFLGGIIVASIPSLLKHKNDHWYNSVGASGGVASVVFASIFFEPHLPIYFYFIPIPIPGFIFGIAYLAYSQYMSKKQTDNINHDAHLYGALFGLAYPILIDYELVFHFINRLF